MSGEDAAGPLATFDCETFASSVRIAGPHCLDLAHLVNIERLLSGT